MQAPSLAGRAFVALALMIGFYTLAIAIVLILLFIPFAEWQFLHRFDLRIAAFCVISAIIIAVSIVPRPDHFDPPGPRLDPRQQPELFVELLRTAQSVDQEMPAEVYLIPDVNAWVAQRGGVMGWGSRRVMGLGLMLMQILSVSEFRAVIAHEFGHFYGGDTRLGPWVYKTRAAIIRTVQSLSGQSEILQMLFVGYAKLFLRVTQAISRQQEFSADALAARTVGAQPIINGLRITHGAGQALPPFWNQEIVPILNAGYQPPLADGFAQFVKTPVIANAITHAIDTEIKEAQADPYDTHPPLRDRIAAIEKLNVPATSIDARPAIALLNDVAGLERQLLLGFDKQFEPIAWANVAQQVYLPLYQNFLRQHSEALQGITPARLPAISQDLAPFLQYLEKQNNPLPSIQAAQDLQAMLISSALTVLLHQHGWTIDTAPGQPVVMRCGEQQIEPMNVFPRLQAGELSAEAWRAQCTALGIGEVDLAQVVERG